VSRQLAALACALGALMACGGDPDPPVPEATPPVEGEVVRGAKTVVLLVLDSVRAEHFTPYGYELDTTPHLAKLARESVVFDDALAATTGTNAAVASVFTGLYSRDHGVASLVDLGQHRLAARHETLAERFAAAGFRTFVSLSLPQLANEVSGLAAGFEAVSEPPVANGPTRNAWSAVRAFQSAFEGPVKSGEPVFAALHLADPLITETAATPIGERFFEEHLGPFRGSNPLLAQALDLLQRRPAKALADLELMLGRSRGSDAYVAYKSAVYDGHLANMDAAIGELLRWLEEHGRAEDALIVVVGTRGATLVPPKDLPGNFLNEYVHVPFFIRFPGGAPSGHLDWRAQPIDVMPTLAAYHEWEPGHVSGADLLGAIASGEAPREFALCADGALERRVAFGANYQVEQHSILDTAIYPRRSSVIVRHDLDAEGASEVAALRAGLAEFARPDEWIVEYAGGGSGGELAVRCQLLGGHVRYAEVRAPGEEPVPRGPASSSTSASLPATGASLVTVASRRGVAARVRLTMTGGSLEESQVFVGDESLAELPLPRLASARTDEWPADEDGRDLPWSVDVANEGARKWRVQVGGDDAGSVPVGEAAEVHLVLYPPGRIDERIKWAAAPDIDVQLVPGRLDALIARGNVPFSLSIERRPSQELGIAVRLGGRIVGAHAMRISGRQFAREGTLELYLADWITGVTDALERESEFAPLAPGCVRLQRRGNNVPPADRSPLDGETLGFLRFLRGKE